MTESLRELIAARPFSLMVEIVASGLRREAQVLEVASNLASLPDVIAGSVTSYAGGALGQDSVRVASAMRARGLTPNVHLTCVSQDRQELRRTLHVLRALGMLNVFTLTGDWPAGGHAKPVFDLDSVQLAQLVASIRAEEGVPFHIAVAVSPFKYQREDCLYQYLKLEKKVAAGANLAITQVGWDARKFVELKRYVDTHDLRIPLFGNVFLLSRKGAEKMAGGSPPGCWASPELVAQIRRESEQPDSGVGARLERAAQTVAVLKGLGYAGAYIGGTNNAAQIARIAQRAAELEPTWEECAERLQFGDVNGFYLDGGAAPARKARAFLPRVLDAAGAVLPVPWSKSTAPTRGRRAMEGLFRWIDRRPAISHLVERMEFQGKRALFGCENCGNCVLGHMEYVCPQTCPKQMRNGPCGGTFGGRCEVVDQECIWVSVYSRAAAADRVPELKILVPAPDRHLQGTSSWLNFFLGRDSRPGRPKAVDATTAPLEPLRIVRNVRPVASPPPKKAESAGPVLRSDTGTTT
jgi:methylenetetrahydrofolate reductase (NADPH)